MDCVGNQSESIGDNDTFTEKNTVTGVASGACRSMKGNCGVSGRSARSVLHIPAYAGESK